MKNVCIIGYGNIGPIHAAALQNVENARFYAVCDKNPERVDACMKDYKVIGYRDIDEALHDENIHSVHICLPHYLHYEVIEKALAHGKEVVVEKPITMTKEEFDGLKTIKGADKVCVVMQNRYNACITRLEEIVKSEKLGKVKGIKGILTWHRDAEYYSCDDWRGKLDKEGGGVLINQAVHTLDLMCFLAGNIKSIKGNIFNYSLEGEIEVEDTAVAYLKFESGASGVFFATNAYVDDPTPQIEVVFQNGTARYVDGKLFVNGENIEADSVSKNGKGYWGAGHPRLIKEYYDFGRYFGINDVSNTMNALFSIYESAEKEEEILL
ncbi:MAG: Gfo/Idh/MocA family oxidoreductase [Clostridia bacterium]|nr:Gfo/Idh/MocA family oxidoreductase [Clostridia bacterium]